MHAARSVSGVAVAVIILSSTSVAQSTSAPSTAPDAAAGSAFNPVADPKAIVLKGNARFTVLSDGIVRLEYSPSGEFEDHASFAFVNRRTPLPQFDVVARDGFIHIRTPDLLVKFREVNGKFVKDDLGIRVVKKGAGWWWSPGEKDSGNLGGTARTLDSISGACPIEPGLLSRDGWVLIDDSTSPVFDDSPWPWAQPRKHPENVDWYFFAHGDDYQRALREYTRIAGRIPLPPRYVFGAWWSRYWAYSDAELRQLVEDFNTHDVPLDVLVVDMDWHLDGWTGYTFNPKYFPDPPGFLKWVKEQGLRTTFNLHPAEGVGKQEQQFTDFCKAMGADPAKTDRVKFQPTNRRFVDAYFKLLHHPLEELGVDFWWMDWQQGHETDIPGLDPLPWLNYLHWTDMERNPRRAELRPLVFSRWGGLGNHRYPIEFSGDTFCNWPSLAFQPYFTATAGNVGCGYWSHDIGGHQPGRVDPELYVRWIQFGAFSPVLRTHTTKNPDAERRIWKFDKPYFEAARRAFHLRYELIPYIYTAARQCYDTGLPLCRPLYYEWRWLDAAYQHPNEYLFGDNLIVAPVTAPMDAPTQATPTTIWLPEGEWINWFTGETLKGPAQIKRLVPLDEIPVFVRAGSIIPTQPYMRRSDEKPIDQLTLHIFGGPRGEYRLYEDDGISRGYESSAFARTTITQELVGAKRTVSIAATQGTFAGMVAQRGYEIRIHDALPGKTVTIDGESLPQATDGPRGWSYDANDLSLVVRTGPRDVQKSTTIEITTVEDAKLEATLRKGLRGRVALFDELAQDFPQPSPFSSAKRTEASLPPLVFNAPRLQEYVSAIASAQVPMETKRRAAARILGLTTEMKITRAATAEKPDQFMATLDAEFDRTWLGDNPVSIFAELKPPPNWKFPGLMSGGLSEMWKSHSELSFELPAGVLQTAVLGGRVTINAGATVLPIELEQALLPSINAWNVCGPFNAPFDKGLAQAFPPEKEIDLAATYDGGKDGKKAGWKPAVRKLDADLSLFDEFFVHLHRFYGERYSDAVAYGLTYLDAPADMDAVLWLGSDDGVAAWLNDAEVHRNNTGRAYGPRQDRVAVKLKKGVNKLLLKINQGGGDWGFSAFIESPDGKPLPQVEVKLAP